MVRNLQKCGKNQKSLRHEIYHTARPRVSKNSHFFALFQKLFKNHAAGGEQQLWQVLDAQPLTPPRPAHAGATRPTPTADANLSLARIFTETFCPAAWME